MDRQHIEDLIYGTQQRRYTQDFPILPDVWIAFGEKPGDRKELLLSPHTRSDAPSLGKALRDRLNEERKKPALSSIGTVPGQAKILFNESVVLACFSFPELMRVAIPLTDWWIKNIQPGIERYQANTKWGRERIERFVQSLHEQQPEASSIERRKKLHADPRMLKKLITIIGTIETERRSLSVPPETTTSEPAGKQRPLPHHISAFIDVFQDLDLPEVAPGLLYGVSLNRPATTSLWRSRMTVKADAAERLFNINTEGIRWAVLDTGIDAQHPAFKVPRQSVPTEDSPVPASDQAHEFESRVIRTYDFLRIKKLLDPENDIAPDGSAAALMPQDKLKDTLDDLKNSLKKGRAVDWDLLEPFLRIPHKRGHYIKPADPHGAHVAGIIAANWPDAKDDTSLEGPVVGMCPNLELYDLRVLGEGADEFTVIAALQFVRHLNAHKDLMAIHGVNLSMSVPHDVANYACGRTPVCEECERVISNGVVVVTAAGNRGFMKLPSSDAGATGDYRYISITDPGNAEGVITVGATHRFMPHNYGVSYFSSRGPTGDGRRKPDLVAPGERISSCGLNDGFEIMDGTSMAAPHVSGAAALLISRHRELIGQPKRVKEILCKSATDLGREPRFQGFGMVDVLRALQSV